MVLLGVRSALKEDLGCTAAELVYGAPLRLPGEFFTPCPDSQTSASPDCVTRLKRVMADIRAPPVRAQHRSTHIHPNLSTCTHVFVRRRSQSHSPAPLRWSIQGPGQKGQILHTGNEEPSRHCLSGQAEASLPRSKCQTIHLSTATKHAQKSESNTATPRQPAPKTPAARTTRYGRTVHWPDRLNL